MPLGVKVGLSLGDIVLNEDPAPPTERDTAPPHFSAHVYCQTAGCIRMPLGAEVDLGRGDILLEGMQSPRKRAQQPHFSSHVYCGGQTVTNLSNC